MAKLLFPSYIMECRGRIGDLVFSTRKGTPYMRAYRKPRVSTSPKLKEVHQAFRSVSEDWKYLPGVIRESWKESVKGQSKSGYNAFIGENLKRRRAGEAIVLSLNMGEKPLADFTAETGTGSGEIICRFSSPEEGRRVTFFSRRETDSDTGPLIIRCDAGADPVSPFTISGLEAGMQYLVYAVVTDRVCDEAETVSESASAVAAAAG